MEEPIPRGEQTRNAILQAAHDLFVQQGYHGTSMRQVAQSAGIALGSLYNHFSSKEDVFEAVFLTYHPYHEVVPLIEESQGDSIDEVIRDAARRMVDAVRERPDFMNLMFIELVEFKSVHARQLMLELLPRGQAIIERFTRADIGQMHDFPPLIVVRSFIGLFFSYYITELIFGEVAPHEFRDSAMDYFLEIYLHGLLKEPAASSNS